MRGIGGKKVPKKAANVKIPSKRLHIILDVEFFIFVADVPTLVSMRDMIKYRLYISSKDTCLIHQGNREPQKMENYWLGYSWGP